MAAKIQIFSIRQILRKKKYLTPNHYFVYLCGVVFHQISQMKKTLLFLTAVFCFSTLMGQQMNKILYYSHLYLESKVNGKTARLVFDTGSPYTCIDSIFVADSNLQYSRIVEGRMGGA